MLSPKIKKITQNCIVTSGDRLELKDEVNFKKVLDQLVWEAVFGQEKDKASARWVIWEAAQVLGVHPSSNHDFYLARGRGKLPLNFTVPAFNLQGIAYDMAQALFKVAKKLKVGALICEIARSEIGYTDQSPEEYVAVILAGAIKAGWQGPLFIQGDHFQTKLEKPGFPKKGEVQTIKDLIKEAIEAGFYCIDVDTSTLVDLSQESEEEQQKPNVKHSLELFKYTRSIQPPGITVSLGGEIGHVGGKNSTVEEFRAYMNSFNAGLPTGMAGICRISIQTGTSHGGVVLPDGSLADIDVDFSVLAEISRACREGYQIGGAVQHGASTLPDQYFKEFVKAEAIEVHLATGFRNIIMDHPKFPKELLKEIYDWLDREKQDERKEGQTDQQFYYKLRKKGWGQFKKETWQISSSIKDEIKGALEKRFTFLFKQLNVPDTQKMVRKLARSLVIHKQLTDFGRKKVKRGSSRGLAD
ncbi:class II fructose-bisphosphate aldolase [Patescibacteria group bacterium]